MPYSTINLPSGKSLLYFFVRWLVVTRVETSAAIINISSVSWLSGGHSLFKLFSWSEITHMLFSMSKLRLVIAQVSGVTSSRAPGGKMLLSRPPPPTNVFTASLFVNHQIQRVRSAVNISSIWCFLPHKSLDQWCTEGFWRLGRRWGLAPLPSACRTGKRKGRSPSLLGGLGRSPSH